MNLTLGEISADVGGRAVANADVKVRGYSIDSRSIKKGELFFAITGPRFDGHDYVDEAARKGAAGAVVSAARSADFQGLPCIGVDSTVDALGQLARSVRRRWGRRIIG